MQSLFLHQSADLAELISEFLPTIFELIFDVVQAAADTRFRGIYASFKPLEAPSNGDSDIVGVLVN
jgi:hypothetical protein